MTRPAASPTALVDEERWAGHAHAALGRLARNDACWSNASATVCAVVRSAHASCFALVAAPACSRGARRRPRPAPGPASRPTAFEEGPCTVEWTDRGAAVTMGVRWDIRERDRQGHGPTSRSTALEAMRYEIDREHYAHATADLNEILDIAP